MQVVLTHAEIAEACASFAARRARERGETPEPRWSVQLQYAPNNGDELIANVAFAAVEPKA